MPATECEALAKSTTAAQPVVGVPPRASALLHLLAARKRDTVAPGELPHRLHSATRYN
ncbi:hypothetical protein PSCICL_37420 [Pseudomonas cichorii]|nr:hypothetical protein PSCICL_37420 [Pseudomonas cichorii]